MGTVIQPLCFVLFTWPLLSMTVWSQTTDVFPASTALYHPNTTEDLNHSTTATTEALYHPNTTTTEDLNHSTTATTEALYHPNTTTTEDLYHSTTVNTEALYHPNTTTTEDLYHSTTAKTEGFYPPTPNTTPEPSYTCGGFLTQRSGVIYSPFYPNNYPDNANCTWDIWTTVGHYVELRILTLDLETHPDCSFDWVIIYDGRPGNSPQLEKICNPGYYTFYSSSNIMGINFRSDHSVHLTGFRAEYTSLQRPRTRPDYYHPTTATTEGFYPPTPNTTPEPSYTCGGFLSQPSGVIYSPFYPNNYPDNANCTWDIRTTVGHYVELRILTLDLETHPNCSYDWVIIYDGRPGYSPQLGKICNPGNYTFYSSSNIMGINFRSDISVHRTGFLAVYTSLQRPRPTPGFYPPTPNTTPEPSYTCGGFLTQRSGVIDSPFYPNNYPDNANCTWDIWTTVGHYVELRILTLDLETHPDCSYDWVIIYDGRPGYSPQLGKICNPGNYTFYSSSNIMGINFRSDISVHLTGFRAVYTSLHRPRTTPDYYHPTTATTEGFYPPTPNTTPEPSYTCGGFLSQPSGVIYSPFYPNNYPDNANCTWDIWTTVGHYVELRILTLDLETHPNCPYDWVIIYDGRSGYSPQLGKICNPGNYTLYSSSNIMGINFRSDISVHRTGFLAVYTSLQRPRTTPGFYPPTPNTTPEPSYTCGGFLTQRSGVIDSPFYPNNYPDNANCTWDIQTTGDYVELRILTLDLETHPDCSFDWVIIYDGLSGYSPQLGKICNPGYYTFYSSSNIMGINFRSDISVHRTGFRAVYTSLHRPRTTPGFYPPTPNTTPEPSYTCGGFLTQPSGVIDSPFYPNNYPDNANCTWDIQTTGDYVELRILTVDLETHPDCSFDWLIIYDGRPGYSPQLGKICNPGNYTFYSSSNIMGINFRSDQSVHRTGFWAVYTSLQRTPTTPGFYPPTPNTTPEPSYTCGGFLTQPSGVIDSPFYPNNYPDNANCTWDIQTTGDYVELRILTVDLETHPDCSFDWLIIYDGRPGYSPQLGKICNPGNYTFYSSSNIMGINFRSDQSVHRTGFWAVYTSLQRTPTTPGFYPPTPNTTPEPSYTCGGFLTQPSGVIDSPFYPNNYPDNANCTWDIQTTGDYVELRILTVDLETHPDCSFDWVIIYDGGPGYSPQLGKICNPGYYTFYSSSNIMGINFRSDISVHRTGFRAVYTSLQRPRTTPEPSYTCGGFLTQPSGVIDSPFYPNNYPDNANCTWDIQTTGDYVELRILTVDLETHPNCSFDWVIIYDGRPGYSPQLGKICNPGYYTFYSSSNIMGINFRSDISVRRTGFRAVYTSLQRTPTTPGFYPPTPNTTPEPSYTCGGFLTQPSGVIDSPFYPNNYPDNANCTWDIQTTGDYVELRILTVDLETHPDCSFDWLIIYDGRPGYSPQLGKICNPGNYTFYSSSNIMGINFRSDQSVHRTGFWAVYTSLQRTPTTPGFYPPTPNTTPEPSYTCGGFLTQPSGVMHSPFHPNNYPDNANCTWDIQTTGDYVELRFLTLDLETHPDCPFDWVIIYDGRPGYSPQLGKICNPGNYTFYSSSNIMGINFRSDHSIYRTGFRAEYTSLQRTPTRPG
ncbi:cubilin-like isoform X3 [Ascaphus truei]|uniref:cubilin-like isoform X3 n=1 Tax=Ascaphus truei TaxID=8439 RepID=UPI003F59EBFC